MTDIIDELIGTEHATALARLRDRRPVTRDQSQAAYDALFSPVDDGAFPLAERLLVAAFVTRLGGDDPTSRHYAALAQAADSARAAVVLVEAGNALASGPYGVYTEEGLRAESTDGPVYEGTAVRGPLGDRVAAAIEHAHLLVLRPREASASDLDALLAAGWSTDGIVTLSQLVSYLAYQQRVAHGLRVLVEEAAA